MRATPLAAAATITPASRRTSILYWLLALSAASLGLLLYIVLQRDLRVQRAALDQARWHADHYARRVGEGKSLPLNFDPAWSPDRAVRMFPLEWISREEARALRGRRERVIVAQTLPLRRSVARDGRAIISFLEGKFSVEWVSLPEFERLMAAQREAVRSVRGEPSPHG